MDVTIESEARQTVRQAHAAQRRRRGWARTLASETWFLLLGLPMGLATFAVAVCGWTTAIGSLLTLIGIPIALLTIFLTRALSQVERRRAGLVLGSPVPAVYHAPLPLHRDDWRELRGIWERLRAIVTDAQTWKDLGYALLNLATGTIGFVIAVACWGATLALISLPTWFWILPSDVGFDGLGVAAAFVAGLAMLPVTMLLVHAWAHVGAAATSGLLGPGRRDLEERVEHLEETRAGAVDAARLELERIERDLHDGAQARIVAVAMELGRAEQKLAAGDSGGATQLVREAREETQRALADLRDLARGIRPALLSERGLAEAITSLTARAGVPSTVEYRVSGRLPTAVETAVYFVVAEALANVAKHAGASSAAVRVDRRGPRLEVEIRDDGVGGADPAGSGLTGMRKRVEALDGTLLISSPSGGPTILRAEIPCAS